VNLKVSVPALESAAGSRPEGYMDEVLREAIEANDRYIVLSEESYQRLRNRFSSQAVPQGGAGTNLKKFFARWFFQKARPGCSCNAVAAQMDMNGPQWCRDNVEWILREIEKNAEKRGLPFMRAIVKPIVLLAIRKAEHQNRKSKEK
jgi:hypothetical protein